MMKDTREHDQLLYANAQVTTMPIMIAAGENIKRGDLLTSNSLATPYRKATAAVTSGVPMVAVADCDASGATSSVSSNGYVAGKFDGRFMNGGNGFSVNAIVTASRDYLAGRSIYVMER